MKPILILTLFLSSFCIHHSVCAAEQRPNIVFILADDLGFEALGCYGGASYKGLGTVRTPNLDAMAAEGMRFKKCFSTPVCSPARSELLTGKYNHRTGFIDIAGRSGATQSLDPHTHPTLPALLKKAGYVTAVAGKWHLGPPDSMKEIPTTSQTDTRYEHPRECGFDRQCILGGAHLELYGKPDETEYTPARMQDWVLRFLDSRRGKAAPFFLYYASPIPHDPLHPTPLNAGGKPRDKSNFPFLIEYLDKQVGELRARLQALGMAENTVVMFSGDNGTHRSITTLMKDGRSISGGKGTMKDTGSQVPLLAVWPGVIKAGAVSEQLVDFTDVLPTCLELAGASPPAGIDGISFAPLLRDQPGKPREWVHSLFVDKFFVRDARWKLREDGSLYDVSQSPDAENLILPPDETAEAKTARTRLKIIMNQLHPEIR